MRAFVESLLAGLGGDRLRNLSILYLALPNLIFLLGWLWWPYALTLGLALFVAAATAMGGPAMGARPRTQGGWHRFAVTALLLFVWLSLSGIGGVGFQNGDWIFRNSVLLSLVEAPWPVVVSDGQSDRLLVSYIAYYLPAALAGKLGQAFFGSGWWLANVMLWSWSFAGVVVALAWLKRHARNESLIAVCLFIAFGGVDLVGWWLTQGELPGPSAPAGNWARPKLQLLYPGTTPQLYWVPHQALAAWIGVSLILEDGIAGRTCRNLVFHGALALLWSPLVTLGLIPYAAWVCVRARFKELASVQNLIGLVLAGVTAIFLTSIESDKIVKGLHWSFYDVSLAEYLGIFALFSILEFGLYALCVRKALVGSPEWKSTFASLFWTATLCLLLVPTYRFGQANDFCMRVSLPSLFVLLTLVATALRPEGFLRRPRRIWVLALTALLVVGSWAAVAEGLRSIRAIARKPAIWSPGVPIGEVGAFEDLAVGQKLFAQQYTAPLDNAFVRTLAPPRASR